MIKIPSQSEINIGEIERRPGRSSIPYVAPFALLAMFTCIDLFYHMSRLLTYPIKTVLVAASLLYFWDAYKQEIQFSFSWLAVISGVVVFLMKPGLFKSKEK